MLRGSVTEELVFGFDGWGGKGEGMGGRERENKGKDQAGVKIWVHY